MQTTNTISPATSERTSGKKQIIVIRHAAANGGVGCPNCKIGELVLTTEPRTHSVIHICLECGYTED